MKIDNQRKEGVLMKKEGGKKNHNSIFGKDSYASILSTLRG